MPDRGKEMVVGVGIDLEQISRFQRIMRRSPHIVNQVYTPAEQQVLRAQPDALPHFAAAFAVKEAMFKALGLGWLESALFWTDIELLSSLSTPAPEIRLSGAALARSRALGATSTLASISCDGGFVVAQVILQG